MIFILVIMVVSVEFRRITGRLGIWRVGVNERRLSLKILTALNLMAVAVNWPDRIVPTAPNNRQETLSRYSINIRIVEMR